MSKNHYQSFICASADWSVFVHKASSFEDAASQALQQQIDNDALQFSVGAVIEVIPVVVSKEDRKLLFSPEILANIGMHKHADMLTKQIDADEEDDGGTDSPNSSNE